MINGTNLIMISIPNEEGGIPLLILVMMLVILMIISNDLDI